MKRRGFIKNILGLAGVVAVPASACLPGDRPQTVAQKILLQQVELAGFQYYAGERLYPMLRCGDSLSLRRAPDNQYDRRAVEVYWGSSMLGHIPRSSNVAVSQMLDRGEALSATIAKLSLADSPWQRIQLAIYWSTS